MILASLVLPYTASSVLSISHFNSSFDVFGDNEIPKNPENVPVDPIASLYNDRVETLFNEYLAISIASSQEFFTRYML